MLLSHALKVPPGVLLASGSAAVAHEDRRHEVASSAVDLLALPDLGQAAACVGGGVGRAGEHVVDQDHRMGRYHVQEPLFPSRGARENRQLLAAFARYRVAMQP